MCLCIQSCFTVAPSGPILGVYIFHYYSSNSITSNTTVFTGVNNFCLRSVAHARASVGSCQPQSAECRCLFTRTNSFDMCVRGAVYAFLAYFLRFRCLNVTALFNIDVKIRFRAVATASCSAAILHHCCGHVSSSTRVPGISVYIFSYNCTV